MSMPLVMSPYFANHAVDAKAADTRSEANSCSVRSLPKSITAFIFMNVTGQGSGWSGTSISTISTRPESEFAHERQCILLAQARHASAIGVAPGAIRDLGANRGGRDGGGLPRTRHPAGAGGGHQGSAAGGEPRHAAAGAIRARSEEFF